MNYSAYVLLGSNGDICAMLPMFYDQFVRTNEMVNVVVSPNYAPIFEGVSYVRPILYTGAWQKLNTDFRGLVRLMPELEALCPEKNVKFLSPIQHNGSAFQKRTPSFITEMWDQADRVMEWDTLPLVFDKRDMNREAEIVSKLRHEKPIILVATQGYTSPFPFQEDLQRLMISSFPDHDVVEIASDCGHRIYDLISLYDAADALVTVDTAHLHLSRASKVPVMALATDKPNPWNGSPCEKRFRFYCRYSDYPAKREQLVKTINRAVECPLSKISATIQGTRTHGYNPSLARDGCNLIMAYRYHPQKTWDTKLALATGINGVTVVDQEIVFPPNLAIYSCEDPRLFYHNGTLKMSYVLCDPRSPKHYCVVGYSMLDYRDGRWWVVGETQVKYGNNDFTGKEKNWVFFSKNDRLYCLYKSVPEQIVLEIDGDKVIAEHKSQPLKWAYGDIHGGTTPIKYGNHLLRFFHSHTKTASERYCWSYYIGAALMNPEPPFETIRISSEPILSGVENWVPNCHHWKPNVVFPAGCVRDGENFMVSFGQNDSSCCVATLKPSDLKL